MENDNFAQELNFAQKLVLMILEKEKDLKEKARNENAQKGRYKKVFTQKKLATELGISEHTYRRKLNKNEFTEVEMGKLAKLLDCVFKKPSIGV